MTAKYRPLPIGMEDFKEIIEKELYYVDKTLLIKELLDNSSKVTLFTRPRRFGKTLNMSMLKYFFEDTGNETLNVENRTLFESLKIMDAGEEYTSRMQRYPVISLTLKSAKQDTFEDAYFKIQMEIVQEFIRYRSVLDNDRLTDFQRDQYLKIMNGKAEPKEYSGAVKFLSECIFSATGRKSIILIDEYDVPLENSHFRGFYDQMISFIRSLFESALKTNPNLEFAVLTGCLRISRESIFTGLNNLRVVSILNNKYAEYFGFTPEEVEAMVAYYGFADHMDDIRLWYDGYRFGNAEVYNPWSVICYLDDLKGDPNLLPRPYWANTSSNGIVRDLIRHADSTAREELETLIAGGTLKKPLHEDITYGEINENQDNLWNFLFFTGYLKSLSTEIDKRKIFAELTIPNDEILSIYEEKISEWFDEQIRTYDLTVLYEALLGGDAQTLERELNILLESSISYLDSAESFYHGFLMGVLQNLDGYVKKSNLESGKGRYDICVYRRNGVSPAAIIELKKVKKKKLMEQAAEEALEQIVRLGYDKPLAEKGCEECWHVGIGFFSKQCRVKIVKAQIDEE